MGERDYALRTARPLRRRLASTRRPPRVAIRARKPCVLLRFRLFGWYVRFTVPPIASRPFVGGKARRLYKRVMSVSNECFKKGAISSVPNLQIHQTEGEHKKQPRLSAICGYCGKPRIEAWNLCG